MIDVSGKPMGFTKEGGLIIFDSIEECRESDWKKLNLSRVIAATKDCIEEIRQLEGEVQKLEKILSKNNINW